jgi:hypothetical protein
MQLPLKQAGLPQSPGKFTNRGYARRMSTDRPIAGLHTPGGFSARRSVLLRKNRIGLRTVAVQPLSRTAAIAASTSSAT